MATGANAYITLTTADKFLPQVWGDEALEAAEFATVVAKRVNRRLEGELTYGKTINLPTLSNLTAQSKSGGTDISFESINETNYSLTISTHKYAAFLLEDAVKVQSKYDLFQMYSKKIGYAMARVVDVDVAALFPSFTTNVVGTLGVELLADDYLSGWQKLQEAGIVADLDPDDEFSIILSPAAYAAALKVDVFTNRLYNTEGDAIQRAHVGNIYGFPVFYSNLLHVSSSTGHDCFMGHKNAIALVIQKDMPVESDHVIFKMGDAVVGWRLYGTAILTYPPETAGGGTAVDNRGIYLKTV